MANQSFLSKLSFFFLIEGLFASSFSQASLPEIKSCQNIFFARTFSEQQEQLSNQFLKSLGLDHYPKDIFFSLGTAVDYFLSAQKFKMQHLPSISSFSEDTAVQMSIIQRNYEVANQYAGPLATPENKLLFTQSVRDSLNQWKIFSKLPIFDRNEKNMLLKSSDAERWLRIVLDQNTFEVLLGETLTLNLTPKNFQSIQNDMKRSSVLRHLVWHLIFDLQTEKLIQDTERRFPNHKMIPQLLQQQMELLPSRQSVRRQFLAYLVKVKGFGSSRFQNAAHSYLDAYEISVRDLSKNQMEQFLKIQLDPWNLSTDAKAWKSFHQQWIHDVQSSNTRWSLYRWWALLFTSN